MRATQTTVAAASPRGCAGLGWASLSQPKASSNAAAGHTPTPASGAAGCRPSSTSATRARAAAVSNGLNAYHTSPISPLATCPPSHRPTKTAHGARLSVSDLGPRNALTRTAATESYWDWWRV